MSQKPKFTADDLMYAYESAADFLENEEWPEDDGGARHSKARNRREAVGVLLSLRWARVP